MNLNLKQNGVYVDATFGRGGHSRAILSSGVRRLIAFDRDPAAQQFANENFADVANFDLLARPFSELEEGLDELGIAKIDGLLMDLGVSSPQFDVAERGFSFRLDGPLDMRMDPNSGEPVSAWLAGAEHSEIARVLRVYGDEQDALKIASELVSTREHTALTRTSQLADMVTKVKSRRSHSKRPYQAKKRIHPATKTFQALRIFINRELEELESVLGQALERLSVGGRLCVISFHSLEDRMVKNFMREHARVDPKLANLPIVPVEARPRLRLVGRAIKAGNKELEQNPRARSAVLRIAERLDPAA